MGWSGPRPDVLEFHKERGLNLVDLKLFVISRIAKCFAKLENLRELLFLGNIEIGIENVIKGIIIKPNVGTSVIQ
jgi:hypothetical protein